MADPRDPAIVMHVYGGPAFATRAGWSKLLGRLDRLFTGHPLRVVRIGSRPRPHAGVPYRENLPRLLKALARGQLGHFQAKDSVYGAVGLWYSKAGAGPAQTPGEGLECLNVALDLRLLGEGEALQAGESLFSLLADAYQLLRASFACLRPGQKLDLAMFGGSVLIRRGAPSPDMGYWVALPRDLGEAIPTIEWATILCPRHLEQFASLGGFESVARLFSSSRVHSLPDGSALVVLQASVIEFQADPGHTGKLAELNRLCGTFSSRIVAQDAGKPTPWFLAPGSRP